MLYLSLIHIYTKKNVVIKVTGKDENGAEVVKSYSIPFTQHSRVMPGDPVSYTHLDVYKRQIEDYTGNLALSFVDFRLDKEPKYSIKECKERDVTYAAPPVSYTHLSRT